MRSYELAGALSTLAKALRKGTNVEVSQIELASSEDHKVGSKKPDIPTALNVLASLASFKKNEWVSIIEEYGLNVEVKKADSTRDLLGRILNHLKDNPKEVEKLKAISQKRSAGVSSELQEALSILLRS